MKVKINLLLVLFTIFALSCKKEGVIRPDTLKVPLIKGVKASGKPQFEFVYNSERLVSEEKSTYNITTFNYNAQNQLVTTEYYFTDPLLIPKKSVPESSLNQLGLMSFTNTKQGISIRYEYNASGQLVKSVVHRPTEGIAEYSEYKYDGNNVIVRELLYWDNKVLGYIDYSYDEKKNMTKEALYSISSSGIAELNTTTQYEFDNRQNPFRSNQRILSPGINTNTNNITREIYTIHHGQGDVGDIIQITTNTYSYSSQGYPVRRSGTIEYIYE